MKFVQSTINHYPPYAKAIALVVFLATPGSMLVLPLVAWWVARHQGRTIAPRISVR